jgi:hypothetical protein
MEENRYKPPAAAVADVDPGVPNLERPAVIRYGAWLLWAETLIGLPGFISAILKPPPEVATGITHIVFIVTMTITFGILMLFTWFTWMAWKGRNWARIVHLVFMLLGLAFAYWAVRLMFGKSTYDGVVSVLQNVMYAVGVALLFTPAANRWYRALREPS